MAKERSGEEIMNPLGDLAGFLSIGNRITARLESALSAKGGSVSIADWLLLTMVRDDVGRSPSEFARKLGVSRQAANQQLKRLEKDNLVGILKVEGTENRRSVVLSDAGGVWLKTIESEISSMLASSDGIAARAAGTCRKAAFRVLKKLPQPT